MYGRETSKTKISEGDVVAETGPDPTTSGDAVGSRQRIIESATQLFVQVGYKGTSMKAIADAVDISPPALYWHFNSKQDLFLASMESLLDQFVTNVQDHLTADEPLERLAQFVRAHVVWKLEQSEAAGAYTSSIGMRDLVHALPANHRSALISKQRQHLGSLRAILDEGMRSGVFTIQDPRIASFAIITMCEYVQSWFDPHGDLSPRDVADHYVQLVNGMVGVR